MATFHNHTRETQRFSIGNRDYTVEAGQSVEIPDNLSYVVKLRGMQLRPGPSPQKDAGTAKAVESLPDRVNVLFASPHVSPRTRQSFIEHWQSLRDPKERSKAIEQLERIAEGRAANDEDDAPVDTADATDDALSSEQPATAAASESDVDAQIGAAAAVAGRARRRSE